MINQDTKKIAPRAIKIHSQPPPSLGKVILDREIPSDVALVTPLIVRVTEVLCEQGIVSPEFRSRFQLCLDEAVRNAVIHGNRRNFAKKVRVRAFDDGVRWGIQVEDEGQGFKSDQIADPGRESSIWREGGRGIHVISHYMEQVEYYAGGRVVIMANSRSPR